MSVVGELDKCDTLVIAVHGLTSAGETFAEVAAKLVESCPGLACLLIDLAMEPIDFQSCRTPQ